MAQDSESQATYKPTEYSDNTYPIVGEHNPQEEFTPMELAIAENALVIDAMFADYGGVPGREQQQRWHLPKQVAWVSPVEREKARKAEQRDDMLKLSKEELEKLLAQAEENGKQLGLLEAVEKQADRFKVLEERLGSFLQDMHTQHVEFLAQVEDQAVKLATAVSQRFIEQAVEINPEYVLELVRSGLQAVGGATIKRIRVSPADMEFIDAIGVRKRIKEFDGSWDFEKDDSIKMGCVIDTSAGEIDGRLDVVWERFRDKIISVPRQR